MDKTALKRIIFTVLFIILCSITWASAQAPEKMMPPGQGTDVPEGVEIPAQAKAFPMLTQGMEKLEVPEDVVLERDVVYATMNGHELKLDIAYPKANKGKIPAILNFHGGGWLFGDKSPNEAVNQAKHGFVGISIQYRKTNIAKFPAAVQDCKTAVRWARAYAKKYGIDPEKIGVMGGSAGAHLASIMGTSGKDPYLEGDGPYKEYSSSVQAVVDNFGPIDFARLNDEPGTIDHDAADGPESQWLGGPVQEIPEVVKKANPITYIDPDDPPVLIMHGENDKDVIISQPKMFYNALTKAGVKTKLVFVKNAGHMFMANPEGATISPSREEIEAIQMAWFEEIFKME